MGTANKKSVLLLNPPGDRNYLRSGYCSSVAKGRYFWPIVDQVILSGLLDDKLFDVHILDGIVQNLLTGDILTYIQTNKIEVVICQVASASKDFDLKLLRDIKSVFPDIMILANGEYGLKRTEYVLNEYSFLDAVIHDYTSSDIPAYLLQSKGGSFRSIGYRQGPQIVPAGKIRNDSFVLPSIPKHHLFPYACYYVPWARRLPMTATLTTFGCAFQCEFCITTNFEYKMRNVDEVIEELLYIRKLGIKEVYFLDSLFNLNKKRTIDLCEKMIQKDIRLTWSCMSRVNTFDEEILTAMKAAGCHTLQLGLENGNDDILKTIHKGFTVDEIRKAVKLAKSHQFQVAGFFILGFPEETKQQMERTVALAKELDLRFASFQLLMPLAGTGFENKTIAADNQSYDDQDNVVALNRHLTSAQLQKIQKAAFRSFYLRIGYVLKQLPELLNINILFRMGRQAFDLLFGRTKKIRGIADHALFKDGLARYRKSGFKAYFHIWLKRSYYDSWLWTVLYFLPARGKLYDLGCGAGLIGILHALMHGNRVTVTGIDSNHKRIESAKAAAHDLDSVRFATDDIANLEPSDASVVLLSDVLGDWPGERQNEILQKIHEKLPAGATLVVKDRHGRQKNGAQPFVSNALRKIIRGSCVHRRNAEALIDFLKTTGYSHFKIIKNEPHYIVVCEKV